MTIRQLFGKVDMERKNGYNMPGQQDFPIKKWTRLSRNYRKEQNYMHPFPFSRIWIYTPYISEKNCIRQNLQ